MRIEGVFSHFATADADDKSYAYEQYGRFQQALDRIKDKGIDIPIRHIANSAAALENAGDASWIWFAQALSCMVCGLRLK